MSPKNYLKIKFKAPFKPSKNSKHASRKKEKPLILDTITKPLDQQLLLAKETHEKNPTFRISSKANPRKKRKQSIVTDESTVPSGSEVNSPKTKASKKKGNECGKRDENEESNKPSHDILYDFVPSPKKLTTTAKSKIKASKELLKLISKTAKELEVLRKRQSCLWI